MAEFMQIRLVEKRTKGEYEDILHKYHLLSQAARDDKLIKRFRFTEEGINFICGLIKQDLAPKHGQQGLPVPTRIQVFRYFYCQINL